MLRFNNCVCLQVYLQMDRISANKRRPTTYYRYVHTSSIHLLFLSVRDFMSSVIVSICLDLALRQLMPFKTNACLE